MIMDAVIVIIVSLMQPSGAAVFCKGEEEGASWGQQACVKDS